jgi:hypothetical protein
MENFKNKDFYKIEKIQKMPNTLDGVHESCYKSFHVMNLMGEMLGRGDSAETILMLLRHFGIEKHEDEFTKIDRGEG